MITVSEYPHMPRIPRPSWTIWPLACHFPLYVYPDTRTQWLVVGHIGWWLGTVRCLWIVRDALVYGYILKCIDWGWLDVPGLVLVYSDRLDILGHASKLGLIAMHVIAVVKEY